MPPAFTESQVLAACHTLFGSDVLTSRAFLHYIQPSGVKSAYRRKAKETHPDAVAGLDPSLQKQQAAVFIEILKAYDTLNGFFKEREEGLWLVEEQVQRPRNTWSGESVKKHAHYGGTIPQRPLELGRYLYYRGVVTYADLIQALSWQRVQRPVIGDIALRWGWLNNDGIGQIIAARHVPGRFGEKAINLGLLSSFQVKTMVFYQRSQQQRLGQYFVQRGLLSAAELDRLLKELHEHNSIMLSRMFRSRQSRTA